MIEKSHFYFCHSLTKENHQSEACYCCPSCCCMTPKPTDLRTASTLLLSLAENYACCIPLLSWPPPPPPLPLPSCYELTHSLSSLPSPLRCRPLRAAPLTASASLRLRGAACLQVSEIVMRQNPQMIRYRVGIFAEVLVWFPLVSV